MKSKMKRRMLAIVLCMVIVLSNSSFIFASSESGTPAVEAAGTEGTASQTETDTKVTETTPQTLAVSESTPAPTDEPAAPTSVEATPTPTDTPEVTTTPEPTGTPTPEATPTPTDTPETTTTPEPTDAPEITTTPELTDTPEATTTPEPTNTPEATPTPTQGPENGTSDTVQPTAIPTPTEAPVQSNEAVELKQEFKDSDGNVTSTVKAQIPEGTFAADASEITMEVQTPDTASAEHVKEMMEELLPENHMLGDYIFYDIQFKVNGTVTEPQKPITITFEGEELSVKDVKRANVFWLDPEDPQVDVDKDQLVEITQKSEMIENLQNSGQSTENIDDYDLSEITLKEDGISDKIQMEGRTSTIYGCYVEKEVVKELVYEDNSVTITVSADESGVIPEDAELSVTPLVKTEITDNMSEEEKAQAEEINAQYDLTEEKLQEDIEENEETLEGFLAYDISFLVNGEEVEPDGDVKVVMDFKNAAIPEGVSQDATVEIKHLKEIETAEDGIVVEDMTEKSTVDTTDKAEVEKVELYTNSFSIYTIRWTYAGHSYEDYEFEINVVDTRGRDLPEYAGNRNDYKTYDGTSASVEDLAYTILESSGIKKYKLEYATIGEYNNTVRISKLGISNNRQRYYTVDNPDEAVENEKNKPYYFVFSEREPVTQINTENTKEQGIKINVFDYQVGKNGDETTDYNEGKNVSSGINSLSTAFKFISDRPKAPGYGIYSQGGGIQSIVQPNLSGTTEEETGYPVLTSGEELRYLFDKQAKDDAKAVYWGVDGLFQKDADGYYFYDSDQNFAYLNRANPDDLKFEVYNQPGSGFFPFTSEDHMFDPKLPQSKAVLGYEDGINHYLGMTIESDFLQPQNGKIEQENQTGETGSTTMSDMTFEFSGDDDVWVYIDGILVLDLGGIHSPVDGSINFANGVVKAGEETTSIRNMFKAAGLNDSKLNELFESYQEKGVTYYRFKDYSRHKIKFFYLERGNDQSNCMIRFNIQTIPDDSILVTKEVVDDSGNELNYADDIEFQFQVEKIAGSSSIESGILKDAKYDILENGVKVGAGTTSTTDGTFTLKNGQSALFQEFKKDDTYKIKEVGAYLGGYDVELDGTEYELVPNEGDGETLPSQATPELKVGEMSNVIFKNTISKIATLSVTKQLAAGTENTDEFFNIEVKIQGKVYKGGYQIYENGTPQGDIQSAANGYISIKANQTAKISGLPYGTSFEVQEILDGSYLPTYTHEGEVYDVIRPDDSGKGVDEDGSPVCGSDGIQLEGITSISGKVSGDAGVIVTNASVPKSAGTTTVTATKTWEKGTDKIHPTSINVTLYYDSNNNGEWDAQDQIVNDQKNIDPTMTLNSSEWTATWSNLDGDKNYVTKEEEVTDFTSETSYTNTFVPKLIKHYTSCNELNFDFETNNMLLVKLTSSFAKDVDYILWTPVDIGISQKEAYDIATKLDSGNNIKQDKFKYVFGKTNTDYTKGINLTPTSDGWNLKFDASCAWAQFWHYSYDRTICSNILNTLNKTKTIDINVSKKWEGDQDMIDNFSEVTIQLYQNGEKYDDGEAIISKGQGWNYTYEELPYYSQNTTGEYIINEYSVQEIKIGTLPVENCVSWLEVDISGSANEGFVITNIVPVAWSIKKVSDTDDSKRLENARFTLTSTNPQNPKCYYGRSVNQGSPEMGNVFWWETENDAEQMNPKTIVRFIPNGVYTLEETKAPAGYLKSEITWTITIEDWRVVSIVDSKGNPIKPESPRTKGVSYVATYVYRNTPLYSLPSAGSSGIFGYTMGGTLLLMAGTLILYKMKRKEVQES